MIKKVCYFALVGLLAASTLFGCQNARSLTSDPTISLAYLMEPSNANLENLSKAYSSAINRNRKENIKQPGLCSDYAVCLALLGQEAEANKWFNKEVSDFPTSRPYVLNLKKQLIPQYANDNTTASESDLNRLSAGDNENTDAIKSVIDEDKAKQAGSDTLDKEKNTPAKEKKTPAKSKKKKSSKKK